MRPLSDSCLLSQINKCASRLLINAAASISLGTECNFCYPRRLGGRVLTQMVQTIFPVMNSGYFFRVVCNNAAYFPGGPTHAGSGGPQLSLGWWSRHKREMIVLPGDTGLPAGLARAQPASRNHKTQLHQLFQQVVDYLMEPRAISCLRKQPLVLTAFILIKMCTARTSRPPSFA